MLRNAIIFIIFLSIAIAIAVLQMNGGPKATDLRRIDIIKSHFIAALDCVKTKSKCWV